MKTNRKYIAMAIFLLLIVLLGSIITLRYKSSNDIWDINSLKLKKQMRSIENNVKTVELSSLTEFEWDNLYSFYDYTSAEKIFNIIGYKWDEIDVAMSEDIMQLVFTNNGKVVCYIYGSTSNLKYSLSLDSAIYNDGVAVLSAKDNSEFEVTKDKGIAYLKQIKKEIKK
jgi:hypothetical protein